MRHLPLPHLLALPELPVLTWTGESLPTVEWWRRAVLPFHSPLPMGGRWRERTWARGFSYANEGPFIVQRARGAREARLPNEGPAFTVTGRGTVSDIAPDIFARRSSATSAASAAVSKRTTTRALAWCSGSPAVLHSTTSSSCTCSTMLQSSARWRRAAST